MQHMADHNYGHPSYNCQVSCCQSPPPPAVRWGRVIWLALFRSPAISVAALSGNFILPSIITETNVKITLMQVLVCFLPNKHVSLCLENMIYQPASEAPQCFIYNGMLCDILLLWILLLCDSLYFDLSSVSLPFAAWTFSLMSVSVVSCPHSLNINIFSI